VTLYSDADPTATITAATIAVEELAIELAAKIQRDIVPSQIIAALSVAGVYGVTLTSPIQTSLNPGQWANCTMISLTTAFSTEHS
jgi:phage-related baseplate assembly protein